MFTTVSGINYKQLQILRISNDSHNLQSRLRMLIPSNDSLHAQKGFLSKLWVCGATDTVSTNEGSLPGISRQSSSCWQWIHETSQSSPCDDCEFSHRFHTRPPFFLVPRRSPCCTMTCCRASLTPSSVPRALSLGPIPGAPFDPADSNDRRRRRRRGRRHHAMSMCPTVMERNDVERR